MGEFTRRGFLVQTSLGVGIALGSIAAFPRATEAPSAGPQLTAGAPSIALVPDTSPLSVSLAESMIVHVRDVATAEIAVLIGTQELVYRDPDLVARLVQTAKQASGREA